jgi:hypothetical protein
MTPPTSSSPLPFSPVAQVPLAHTGDCSLLGCDPADGAVFAEETYGDDETWLAQHIVSAEGALVASLDEAYGAHPLTRPITHARTVRTPQRAWETMALNFAGPRQRGMRAADRLDEVIQPFGVAEKFALAEALGFAGPPPHLLGIAESYVLAELVLDRERTPQQYAVCRRVRVAHLLPAVALDAERLPYDYDTFPVFVLHLCVPRLSAPSLADALAETRALGLLRPMDCLQHRDRVFVAEGSAADAGKTRPSAVHIFHNTAYRPPRSAGEALRDKLYGSSL